jgi:RimJ/RimL family protein N-acetyltransferase
MPTEINLRAFTPADAEPMYAAIRESLPEVSPWLTSLTADLTLTDIGRFIAHAQIEWDEATAFHHVIAAADDGRVLGSIGLAQINKLHQFANIYYWVRTSAARQGVASAAVRQVARFGFGTLGLRRLEIVMAVGNAASRRAAEKAGATYEGRLRNRLMMYTVSHDAFMFSLVPDDMQTG